MILIMLGAPGTGKGTVATKLSEKFKIPQISTGDIFRKAISEKTKIGIEAEKYISQGNLVPDDLTIEIVNERLKCEDAKKGFILDGFPRTIYQAEALDEILDKNGEKVTLAINLETPEDEIIDRIINRRVCSNQLCKATYNLKLNPPKIEGICDKCGEKLIQRKDDTEETIKNRLVEYSKKAMSILEYYDKENVLYSTIVSVSKNKMAVDVADDVYRMLTK